MIFIGHLRRHDFTHIRDRRQVHDLGYIQFLRIVVLDNLGLAHGLNFSGLGQAREANQGNG
ncbi:hypothetical protein D3C81_1718320 [compost metagenome]